MSSSTVLVVSFDNLVPMSVPTFEVMVPISEKMHVRTELLEKGVIVRVIQEQMPIFCCLMGEFDDLCESDPGSLLHMRPLQEMNLNSVVSPHLLPVHETEGLYTPDDLAEIIVLLSNHRSPTIQAAIVEDRAAVHRDSRGGCYYVLVLLNRSNPRYPVVDISITYCNEGLFLKRYLQVKMNIAVNTLIKGVQLAP